MLRPGLNAVHLEAVFETVHEPLLVLDDALRVVAANTAFYRTFEAAEGDTLGRRLHSLGDGQWNIPRLRPLLEEVLPQNATVEGFEVEHVFERVGRRVIVLNALTLAADAA